MIEDDFPDYFDSRYKPQLPVRETTPAVIKTPTPRGQPYIPEVIVNKCPPKGCEKCPWFNHSVTDSDSCRTYKVGFSTGIPRIYFPGKLQSSTFSEAELIRMDLYDLESLVLESSTN